MSNEEKIAKHVTGYISKNLDKSLTISILSEQFHIGKTTLEHIFHHILHTTVHHYILEQRLKKSRKLLITTDRPIKAIASQCGFKSVTTFTREFHHHYHLTPSS
ncbi:MAG: helix-turn-helix domain-containing protein, partial [Chitinophagaceae bacterium]